MIDRYEDPDIARIASLVSKGQRWQMVELAVTLALEKLGHAPVGTYNRIATCLMHPVDVALWLQFEAVNHHDFNAWQEERLRFIPVDLQQYFHPDTTSYDTEEPALSIMLEQMLDVTRPKIAAAEDALIALARRYRFTPMYARTHGQGAKMMSFGKRCLSHLAQLRFGRNEINHAAEILAYSKISGAVGNYGGRLTPEIEKEALAILGRKPFYGASQIMPRVLFNPLASALADLVQVLQDIALDLRLAARSGIPTYQEPFGKKQKGSSAMPHKRNTIGSEQTHGMANMAAKYEAMIKELAATMEERSIEQSSVERVAWPDLFHVTCQALKTMTRILKSLQVNPDNMMKELHEARGCYASDEAKGMLKELGAPHSLSTEDAYRIVQLAAFNVHEPSSEAKQMRANPAAAYPAEVFPVQSRPWDSIELLIREGRLVVCEQLEATGEQIASWNDLLKQIFTDDSINKKWHQIFTPPFLLRQEAVLYQEILGE